MSVTENIIKKYGPLAIQRLGDSKALMVPVIPTGSLALDLALGVGGIPRGRITEIFGPFQSGKTTLCQHIIAECQKMGGKAAFIDVEHALSATWAETCGVNIEDLWMAQPDYGEQALDMVTMLSESGEFDLIVMDSIAGLLPKAELEGEIGDAHMALTARLMSQAMRKLAPKVSDSKAAVVFTNQLRMKIGVMFGSPEVTTGGEAIKYFSSVRIDVRKRDDKKEADSQSRGADVIGNVVRAKVQKNKVAPPFKVAEFTIFYDTGISLEEDLVTLGLKLDVIKKSGAGWMSMDLNGEAKNLQGTPNFRKFLVEDKISSLVLENRIRHLSGLPLRNTQEPITL